MDRFFVRLFVSFLLLASALVSYGEVVTFTPHLQLVVLFLERHWRPSQEGLPPTLTVKIITILYFFYSYRAFIDNICPRYYANTPPRTKNGASSPVGGKNKEENVRLFTSLLPRFTHTAC